MSSISKASLIVVPAHNESLTIGHLIERTLPLRIPILVVANGCSDNTAQVARNKGATVLEMADSGYYEPH